MNTKEAVKKFMDTRITNARDSVELGKSALEDNRFGFVLSNEFNESLAWLFYEGLVHMFLHTEVLTLEALSTRLLEKITNITGDIGRGDSMGLIKSCAELRVLTKIYEKINAEA